MDNYSYRKNNKDKMNWKGKTKGRIKYYLGGDLIHLVGETMCYMHNSKNLRVATQHR